VWFLILSDVISSLPPFWRKGGFYSSPVFIFSLLQEGMWFLIFTNVICPFTFFCGDRFLLVSSAGKFFFNSL